MGWGKNEVGAGMGGGKNEVGAGMGGWARMRWVQNFRGGGKFFLGGVLTVFHLIKVGMPVNLNCGCFLNSFSGSFHLEQKRYGQVRH